MHVKPKKHLGQHFLTDQNIALKIVDSLGFHNYSNVLEVGPGTGVLTKFLVEKENINFKVVEIDTESVTYLEQNYPSLQNNIISADFLKLNLEEQFEGQMAVIGNFPYNISSQIYFKIFDQRNKVSESVGMIQKEVAERIAAKPGNKTYGILSVLLQAFYDIEYLFTVHENVFNPPPKVKSAVIRLKRNTVEKLDCNEKLFTQVVKAGFNMRRKTLRNSLKPLIGSIPIEHDLMSKRPEQLDVASFVKICQLIEQARE